MGKKHRNNLPRLPKNIVILLIKIIPLFSLIWGGCSVMLFIASLLGLLPFLISPSVTPIALFILNLEGGTGYTSEVLWFIASLLLLAGFPGVKAQKKFGWNLLFWSQILHFCAILFALSSTGYFLLIGIIETLVIFYCLFQIRNYYK